MSDALKYLVEIHDARGPGMRRHFGPYDEAPQELVDEINEVAREHGPRRATAPDLPAIRAYVGWVHEPGQLTIANAVHDAPHPETGDRPSDTEEATA